MPTEPRLRRVWIAGVLAAITLIAFAVSGARVPDAGSSDATAPGTWSLHDGWAIASSSAVGVPGEEVSSPGFNDEGWTPATVPSTVLGALTQAGSHPGIYEGTTIEDVPDDRFEVPWWYRTEFELPSQPGGSHTWLHLQGVNYRAQVWLNGTMIADADQIVGTFRRFDLDITDEVRAGSNVVAVRVEPVDAKQDLTITWIDWNPLAPDHGMGLWQPVTITRTGPVTVSEPRVVTDLPLPDTSSADLTIRADVHNVGGDPLTTTVRATSMGHSVSQDVDLEPGEQTTVSFDPASFPELHVADPALWWPYRMGGQPLESVAVTASVGGSVSDASEVSYGVREITSDMTPEHHRRFLINGVPLTILGAGWASDMLLRPVPERVDAQLMYVRDLGLNTVRLEGKLETDHFYAETDRLGILVLPGWMCCDHWQKNADWSQEDFEVAAGSMRDQARRVGNHPSVIGFMIGSDTEPPEDIAALYVDALDDAGWTLPVLASASQGGTELTGPTGVKMTGPYDWVPPGYWYDPRGPGAAFGFNTETSAGASIPEMDGVRRMLTAEEARALWSEPSTPQDHAGTGASQFNDFAIFHRAMAARVGSPTSLSDFVRKAQVMQYENERAMFEAFSGNRPASTGLIQWMLNNAWPSLHWNLFDWYLQPNGSYFGAKKANEPVHVQYRYDDQAIQIVNDTMDEASGLTAEATLFDLDGSRRWRHRTKVDVAAHSASDGLFQVPRSAMGRGVSFLHLELTDATGTPVSTNTYWLTARDDLSAFDRSEWFVTPTARYADMRSLADLPVVAPTVSACFDEGSGDRQVSVTVEGSPDRITFFLRFDVMAHGRPVTPILWSDNDLTLMPGESRTVSAAVHDASDGSISLRMQGWNVPMSSAALDVC